MFFVRPIVSLWELMTPGCCKFGPKGHDWQDLCTYMKGTTKHCYILNIQALGLVVSGKKIFLCYSNYKPLADNDAPWAWPIWTPWAWLAGFIKGVTKQCYTQNKNLLASWFQRRRFFLCFSCCRSMEANDHRGVANLDPRGMIGRIYVGFQ